MDTSKGHRPDRQRLPWARSCGALLLAFVLGHAQPVAAQQVTYRVTGTVESVFDPQGGLPDEIGTGDLFTAWYTFDPTTPAILNDPGESAYAGAVECVRAVVEGFQFDGEPGAGVTQNLLLVQDDAVTAAQPDDSYSVILNGAAPDFSLFSLVLNVLGPSDAIQGTGIPAQPPVPALFAERGLALQFSDSGAFLSATVIDLLETPGALPCGGPPTGERVAVPAAPQAPQIDGQLGFGEWKGAARRSLEGGEMRLLHDDVRLYVLIDMLADATDDPAWLGGFDQFWLAFDVDEDGSVTPNLDRRYRMQEVTGNLRYETYCASCGFGFNSASPSTYSARAEGFGCFFADRSLSFFPRFTCNAHRVWELAIDLEEIRALGDRSARMGYLVQGSSSDVQVFPSDLAALAGFIDLDLQGATASGNSSEPAVQTGLEITQAIQDDVNGIELVARKPTVARAFLTTLAPETATAIVSVAGRRGGVDLPGSPLVRSMEAAEVPDSTLDVRRAGRGNSADWRVPEGWTQGNVDFSLSFRRPWLLTAGGGSPQRISFVETVTPTYWTVPVDLGTAASPSLPGAAFMDDAEDATFDLFPVDKIDFVRRPPLRTGNTNSGALKERLNELHAGAVLAWTLGLLFTGESPFDLPDQIFAFTPRSICSNPPNCTRTSGGSSDPVWGEGNGYVSWGGPTASSGRYVLAHEINHNLDRNPDGGWGNHVGGCNADTSPVWPYPDPNIQDWGYQARFGPMTQSVVEDFTPDLMSYCQEVDGPIKWISPYRWNALLDNIYRAPSGAGANAGRSSRATAEDVEDAYYIRGSVFDDDTGALLPALAQPGWPEPSAGTGDHAVEVRSCAGDLLSERRFTPNFVDPEGEVSPVFHFFYQLPADPDACAIRLVSDAGLLAEIARSPNPPTVALKSPGAGAAWSSEHVVEWDASDADGDALSFSLLYSPDDGATWRPVASGITDLEATVDSAFLAASPAARLRVIATDGFHTVHDDSDAAFSVAEAAPRISVSPNSASGPLPRETPVEFSAVARGKDGRPIDGGGFLWSVDGEAVAQGNPVWLRLAADAQQVSVSAAEGDGPVGEASYLVPEPSAGIAWAVVSLALACLGASRGRASSGRARFDRRA